MGMISSSWFISIHHSGDQYFIYGHGVVSRCWAKLKAEITLVAAHNRITIRGASNCSVLNIRSLSWNLKAISHRCPRLDRSKIETELQSTEEQEVSLSNSLHQHFGRTRANEHTTRRSTPPGWGTRRRPVLRPSTGQGTNRGG